MDPDKRQVLVIMHQSVGYLYGVQLGIAKYATSRPDWVCRQVTPRPEHFAGVDWRTADGAIAFVEEWYVPMLCEKKIPIVEVSNWVKGTGFPQILPDDRAAGRMAAEYLRSLGLRHFAVATMNSEFSRLRQCAFRKGLGEDGFDAGTVGVPHCNLPPGVHLPVGMASNLAAWLLVAPKPIGIFAVSDAVAREILEVCRQIDVRIPDDVCVLGVDNDELLTQMSTPPLSSISLPTQKIGFEAAALLDRLMDGAPRPAHPILFPPGGVVTRQSTDLLAVADEDVRTALRFIREHIHERIRVSDILRMVPVNRRYLERKFLEHIGRTPLQEIQRARLARAKYLLITTDMPMPMIARKSGFANAQRLATVFRANVGLTPTAYRQQSQITQV